MKVEIGENNSLLVFLDKKDVNAFRLDLHQPLSEDADTKRILQSIYRDAALLSGFVPQSTGAETIELLPFRDGSLLICFSFKTHRPKMKVRAARKHKQRVWEFEDADHLARFFESAPPHIAGEIFEESGCFRFITTEENAAVLDLLPEFSLQQRAPFALERTREYWHAVINNGGSNQ